MRKCNGEIMEPKEKLMKIKIKKGKLGDIQRKKKQCQGGHIERSVLPAK